MKRILVLAIVFSFLLTPVVTDAADLNDIIASLRAQIATLEAQIQNIISGTKITVRVADSLFKTNLYRGIENSEVRQLQELFARDLSLYPQGLVTGYFGPLTEEAVRRFQTRHGIPAIGVVGPQTIAKLNEAYSFLTTESSVVRTTKEEPAISINLDEPPVVDSLTDGDENFSLDPKPKYDLSVIERLIQEEINKERELVGAQSLDWQSSLATLARRHAGDHVSENINITDPTLVCTYPVLHHSGFTFGKSVAERAKNSGIDYRRIGENLAMFRAAEDLVYRYRVSQGPIDCPKIEQVDPFIDSLSELRDAIEEREDTLESLRSIEWVNREWLTEQQIAEKAVELWLDSPSHRKNMLNPEFSEGGVGLAMVNDHIIAAHVLRNP